jgi:hypothetical protein
MASRIRLTVIANALGKSGAALTSWTIRRKVPSMAAAILKERSRKQAYNATLWRSLADGFDARRARAGYPATMYRSLLMEDWLMEE